MYYDIKCAKCNYNIEWNCTIKEYEKKIKEKCPECKGDLFQNMNKKIPVYFIGKGWTRAGAGRKGNGYYRKGSEEDLTDALRENDLLQEMPKKSDIWKKNDDKIKEQASKFGIED